MPEQTVEQRIEAQMFGDDKSEEVTDQAEDEQEDQPVEGDDSPEPESDAKSAVDEVEIEVEGWKGKIPTRLKAELDKAADYTRKTQEVAEEKRLIQQQRRVTQEEQAFQQSAQAELDRLKEIEGVLSNYRKVDITSIDNDTLNRMRHAADGLREEKTELQANIGKKQADFKKRIFSAWDEMANQAKDVVTKTVPDWEANASKVAEWAINSGFPFELITGYDRATRERVGPGVVDLTFAKTLHKAWKWDQLQSSKGAAVNKTKAAPIVKTGATDPNASKQGNLVQFRKQLKSAGSDMRKAEMIGDRIASKLFK